MPKLDPTSLIGSIAEHAGIRLEITGRPLGGEVGAAFVRGPDGRAGVLTSIGYRPVDHIHQTAQVLRTARDHGLPVPSYDLVVELPETVAVVQQRLPGTAPAVRDRALAEAMVQANARMAGLLDGLFEVPVPDLFLSHSGPGFCVHESLQMFSDRTRRLLEWVREVGAETSGGSDAIDGVDLVHLDFHPGNVLVDGEGRLSGIVDWDGLGRGDRRLDLVTLRFEAAPAGFDAATVRWLDGLLDEILDPATLRAFWAHMSLRSVDWVIRHYSPADVEDRLDVAESRMR